MFPCTQAAVDRRSDKFIPALQVAALKCTFLLFTIFCFVKHTLAGLLVLVGDGLILFIFVIRNGICCLNFM